MTQGNPRRRWPANCAVLAHRHLFLLWLEERLDAIEAMAREPHVGAERKAAA
ncbi:MAG: hypothetical protein M3433_02670 [Actinomycetota bacterium]|nr:hypothetical protein [Actinomycetota bacterium]